MDILKNELEDISICDSHRCAQVKDKKIGGRYKMGGS
jgi:hypothetical protein